MIARKTIRATTLVIAALASTTSVACDKEQPASAAASTPGSQPAPTVTTAPLATKEGLTASSSAEAHLMPNGMPMQGHSGHPMGGGAMNGAPGGDMNMKHGMKMDGGTMDGGL